MHPVLHAAHTYRDDLECLVYCLFEMSHPTLRLPWNRTLTTNEEAKEGWSMKQLERMSKKKTAAWQLACKQVCNLWQLRWKAAWLCGFMQRAAE